LTNPETDPPARAATAGDSAGVSRTPFPLRKVRKIPSPPAGFPQTACTGPPRRRRIARPSPRGSTPPPEPASLRCRRRPTVPGRDRRGGATGPAGPAASATNINALKSDVSTLQGQVKTLQQDNTTLTGDISALQATLTGVKRAGSTLLLSGLNLQLESGAGATSAPVNGLGNLIIGYNGAPGTQTGSANLVIGDGQAFTSYGGIVAGHANTLAAPDASVLGGEGNQADAADAAILGGHLDTVTGACSTFPATAQTC
jgi:hypothetical protein